MAAPNAVAELVERFDEHRETYRSGRYNEAQLRGEFLNPLFEALGWDMYNRKGYAEAYKEVIHEAAIKVGRHAKAPDDSFWAGGGKPSFFVEAKKPSVDIRDAVSPAYQLRRYAWSAKRLAPTARCRCPGRTTRVLKGNRESSCTSTARTAKVCTLPGVGLLKPHPNNTMQESHHGTG